MDVFTNANERLSTASVALAFGARIVDHALVSKTIKQLVMAKEIVVTLRMGMEHANVMMDLRDLHARNVKIRQSLETAVTKIVHV